MQFKKGWVFVFAMFVGLTFILGQSLGTAVYAKDYGKSQHRWHKSDKSCKSYKWGKSHKWHKWHKWDKEDELITVLNPLGQPPGVQMYPLAPRFDTLEGQTIYIVDTKYPGSKTFGEELTIALETTYPDTTWIYREKIGTYFDDDPELWAEIQAQGAGMVIFVGH